MNFRNIETIFESQNTSGSCVRRRRLVVGFSAHEIPNVAARGLIKPLGPPSAYRREIFLGWIIGSIAKG